jgi:hypothetical protein
MPAAMTRSSRRRRNSTGATTVSGTDTSVPLNAVTSRMALRFCKAPGIDDLGEVTLRRPKLERFRIGPGKNCTSALRDLVRKGLAVRHLYAPMMNARAGSGQLRLLGIFAVVDHQRQMKLRSGRRSFNAHSSPSILDSVATKRFLEDQNSKRSGNHGRPWPVQIVHERKNTLAKKRGPRRVAAGAASLQRRLALIFSSIAEPGHRSFSVSELSGASTVSKL